MATGNARTYLDRIGVKCEHSPQDWEARADRLEIFNRHVLDIATDQMWRFLQTEADFLVWQKRDYDFTGLTVTVTFGSNLVTWSGDLGAQFMLNNEGMEFNDGLDDPLTSKYVIGRFGGIGTSFAYLDRPYEGSSGVLTTWFIGNDKVLLPADCAQPLGFIDRETGRGRLISWDRRREEVFLSPLGPGQTGDVWWVVDGDTPYDRPPNTDFTGSLSTVGGTLTPSSIYQYAYTFTWEGRESPPSCVVAVTTGSGGTNQVVLTGLENTEISGPGSGPVKKVYRRQVTSGTRVVNSGWLYLDTVPNGTTTYTDNGSATPVAANDSPFYYEGPSQFMNPKFTPAQDATLRIRYLLRVRKLVSDSDVLGRWPGEYLDLPVIMTAMEIVGSNSELAKSRDWERQAQALKHRMMDNWVQVPDLPTQKGGWGVGPYGYTINCGRVVSNFSGNT